MWRIIGVFGGQTKIVRDDFYSAEIAWNTNGTNDWENATLQKELNGTFLSSIDSTSNSFIDKDYRWNLGAAATGSITRTNMYQAERGTTVASGRKYEWNGAIGLIYPSDYAYSTSATNSVCEADLYNWKLSENVICRENSWMFKSLSNNTAFQYTITPVSITSGVMAMGGTVATDANNNIGNIVAAGFTTKLNAVKPALYLESTTKIKSGAGTAENPYILGK